eukprot:5673320-Pyramimonas_sp.AAC.1
MSGSRDADGEVASSPSAGDDPGATPDLNAVLRVMAETQRDLLRLQREGGPRRTRLLLSQVKLPEFDGDVKTSTKRYREWRTNLSIIQNLNQLTDSELALIIFSQ